MNHTLRIGAASRVVAIVALATMLAACGGGEQEQDAATDAPAAADTPAGSAAAPAESPDDPRMANAVVTGKTSAPVDLKYDLLSKPAVGQPFELELVFLPRLAADRLEVEVTGIPGLTVVTGGTAQFDGVAAGERYPAKVLARADEGGIYYANVVAKLVTQLQTDARTFSVPIAVGVIEAAQKPAPQQDASGEAIHSMPAVESGGAEQRAQGGSGE
jgi:hypothetical protein